MFFLYIQNFKAKIEYKKKNIIIMSFSYSLQTLPVVGNTIIDSEINILIYPDEFIEATSELKFNNDKVILCNIELDDNIKTKIKTNNITTGKYSIDHILNLN